jgi:hypothetical protein
MNGSSLVWGSTIGRTLNQPCRELAYILIYITDSSGVIGFTYVCLVETKKCWNHHTITSLVVLVEYVEWLYSIPTVWWSQ